MEHTIGHYLYDGSRPVGPDYDSPVRTNMIYDAVPRAPLAGTTGFVYDSMGLYMPVAYDVNPAVQTYAPPLPRIKVTDDLGPIADEPTIIERKVDGTSFAGQ